MGKLEIDNLYYSEEEKIAFWISGYDYNSSDVIGFINYLEEQNIVARKLFGCKIGDVKTLFVENNSTRYKRMRVFHAKVKSKPKGAFELNDDWTMAKWINN